MPNQEEIEIHRDLLLAHRQTLSIYLKQLALAGRIHAPPSLFHGIDEARIQIRYLKAVLRSWNEPLEDLPIDEEMRPITHAPALQGMMPYERKHLFTILDRETLALGSTTSSIFQRLLAPEFANCSIECYLRIVDDGGNPSNWAGIRVRGFSTAVDDIGFGYLTYLRASGRVQGNRI